MNETVDLSQFKEFLMTATPDKLFEMVRGIEEILTTQTDNHPSSSEIASPGRVDHIEDRELDWIELIAIMKVVAFKDMMKALDITIYYWNCNNSKRYRTDLSFDRRVLFISKKDQKDIRLTQRRLFDQHRDQLLEWYQEQKEQNLEHPKPIGSGTAELITLN